MASHVPQNTVLYCVAICAPHLYRYLRTRSRQTVSRVLLTIEQLTGNLLWFNPKVCSYFLSPSFELCFESPCVLTSYSEPHEVFVPNIGLYFARVESGPGRQMNKINQSTNSICLLATYSK